MPRASVKKPDHKPLSLSEGLSEELSLAEAHLRFQVLQKHIRFQVLDAIVRRCQNTDMINFILQNHLKGEQLSQRDITARIQQMSEGIRDEEKLAMIREIFESIWEMVRQTRISECRGRVDKILGCLTGSVSEQDKRVFYNRAIENGAVNDVLDRIKSFDHKTVERFISTFRIPVRKAGKKWSGKGAKKKMSEARTANNNKMWADPTTRAHLCERIRVSWRSRKIAAMYEDQ